MYDTPSYYGDPGGEDEQLKRQRQQQALNAALVDQQNTVDPSQPIDYTPSGPPPQSESPINHPVQTTNGSPTDPSGNIPVADQPGGPGDTPPTQGSGPPPVPGTPGPAPGNDQNAVHGMYSKWLGRGASDAEVNGWLSSGLSLSDIENKIANSPEASAYAGKNKGTKTEGGQNPGPTPGPTPNAPLPTNAIDWQTFINSFMNNKGAVYTPGQLPKTPLPTYTPQNLMSPDAMSSEASQFALLQKVLANPDAYSEENVRQMQEAEKEQALALQKGNMQHLTDRMAAQGRVGSGYQGAQERRMNDDTMASILSSNRDVSLNAANANFASRLNALQSASGVIGNSVGLRGQQADEVYKGYQSQNEGTRYALQTALAQEGLNQAGASSQLGNEQLALQAALGAGGLSLQQYQSQLGNNLGWYNSLSGNNNFLQNLMAQLAMFNTQQKNSTNNSL